MKKLLFAAIILSGCVKENARTSVGLENHLNKTIHRIDSAAKRKALKDSIQIKYDEIISISQSIKRIDSSMNMRILKAGNEQNKIMYYYTGEEHYRLEYNRNIDVINAYVGRIEKQKKLMDSLKALLSNWD